MSMRRILQLCVASAIVRYTDSYLIPSRPLSQLCTNKFMPSRLGGFNCDQPLRVRTIHSLTQLKSGEQQVKEPRPIVESFGKGLMRDIKQKLPHAVSDVTDGFRIKTLSSTFFLFFACLAPAIAFGGLLSIATKGAMGTVEAVGATALGGVLYALFAGQPITIIGTTGPLLAFLKVLYDACAVRQIPFLPVYAWVGLWSSLFLYLSSFFSLSNLVEYFTKFTDDIFSTLISVIFIFEAIKELYLGFANPAITGLQATSRMIIALTTFMVARTLSSLRKTPYFPRKVRSLIADFAPTLGVLSGIAAAKGISSRYAVDLPMLAVPAVLSTTSGRPWLVDIFAISNKIKLLTILPALMATVLLFMDQNITVRLIMSKKNKLKKGSGIHLDMLVVAIVTTITSVLGMPWMVAATVRSLAHLRSLGEYETKPATGEVEFTGVVEQRMSGLLIHSLIGGSVLFCRPLLRQVPVAVLTGLFLYLGVSSISTTEMFDRCRLFFSDKNDVNKSSPWWINGQLVKAKLFTAVQVVMLAAMWAVKETKLGVFFPVLIGLLAPIRIALEKWNVFSKPELEVLDGEIE